MKKKFLTIDSFRSLQGSIPVLTLEEMIAMIGGNYCVLACLSDIDPNSNHTTSWYDSQMEFSCLRYNCSTNGGVNSGDISYIGSLGGLNVSEIKNGSSLTFNNSTGVTSDGANIMMIFNNGVEDHAVIVTNISSNGDITYRDPANGGNVSTVSAGDYPGLYSIKKLIFG